MSFITKSRIKMQNGSMSKHDKPPQVVHKPKPKLAAKLGKEEAEHLHNIMYGGLMRKVTPAHIEAQLIKQGHIRRAVGGLMPTEAGFKALTMWEKSTKK